MLGLHQMLSRKMYKDLFQETDGFLFARNLFQPAMRVGRDSSELSDGLL